MITVVKWIFTALLLLMIITNISCIYMNDKKIKAKYMRLVESTSNYTHLGLLSIAEGVAIYYIFSEGFNMNYLILASLMIACNTILLVKFSTLIINHDVIVEENFLKGECHKIFWDDITSLALVQKNRKSRQRNSCHLSLTCGNKTIHFGQFTFTKSHLSEKIQVLNSKYRFDFKQL